MRDFELSRARVAPWGLLLVASVLFVLPLSSRPLYGIAVAALVLAVVGASRSIAYPLGLAGFAAPIVALAGHDPFPPRAVPVLVFAWLVVALVFGGRDAANTAGAALRSAPGLLSLGLFALMLLRLPASTAPAYGDFKLELFVIGNLALFAAGIVLGRQPRRFELFLLLTLAIDALSGLLVARRFGTQIGPVTRYGLLDQSVIALGIQGAQGVMIATDLMLKGSTPWRQLAGLVCLPITIVALLASGSRGPVLGGAVALVVLLVMLARTRTSAFRVAAVVAAFVVSWVVVGQVVPSAASQRALSALTNSGTGLSGNGRTQLWGEAWGTMMQHPVLGAGTGSFATRTATQLCPGPGCLERYPHNVVLETGAELGIPGALMMVAFILTSGWLILRMWLRAPDLIRSQAAAIFALFVAATTTSLLTGDISGDGSLWLAAGLGIGLAGFLGAATGRASAAGAGVDPLEDRAPVRA
jgi:O-antigen ligase